ncbi:MAG: hypothetical protein ACREMV_02760 [Gemmatimonadales bacterium]
MGGSGRHGACVVGCIALHAQGGLRGVSQVRRRQHSVAAILVVVGGLCCGGDATGPGGVAFQNLSAGLRHTCGIGAGGVGYCWGDNARGRLGVGDTTSRSDPAGTVGGVRFTSVSGGGFHTGGRRPRARRTAGVRTRRASWASVPIRPTARRPRSSPAA